MEIKKVMLGGSLLLTLTAMHVELLDTAEALDRYMTSTETMLLPKKFTQLSHHLLENSYSQLGDMRTVSGFNATSLASLGSPVHFG